MRLMHFGNKQIERFGGFIVKFCKNTIQMFVVLNFKLVRERI